MVSAREIFLGFSRYYNSLNIIYSESLSTHTGRLLSYFDELGRMLGYRILSENTLRNLVSTCPKKHEKKKVDIIWNWEEGETESYELAVESQQSPNMSLIKKDTVKLAIVPSRLKVLYCAAEDHNKILAAIRKIRKQWKDNQGEFLAIVDPWVGTSGFAEGTLRGILLSPQGRIEGEGTAKTREIVDGVHNIRMFLNAKWQVNARA